jgi:Lrp/AsnC family transcriptional regulator, leucine-responsive regulatory protein
MVRIDTLDEQILGEMQANGRLTMKALAEHVGLSSPAMIERVRRLEERGVIEGYRAIISPEAIGRPLMALIRIAADHGTTAAILDVLSGDPGVVEAHRLTGAASILARAHLSDTAALAQLLDAISSAGGRAEAEVVLGTLIESRGLSAPEGTVRERVRLGRRDGQVGGAADDEADLPGDADDL